MYILRKFFIILCMILLTHVSQLYASPLSEAIKKGDIKKIEELFASGISINEREEPFQRTPLHFAAEYGNPLISELLIERGAEINAKDILGRTPFHIAIANEHLDVAKVLLEKGANPAEKDNEGNTPLHLAAEKGAIKSLFFLFNFIPEIEIDSTSKFGLASLSLAIREGRKEAVILLLLQGANPNVEDDYGTNPFMLSIQRGRIEIFELFLMGKLMIASEVNFSSAKDGKTPLHFAASKGDMNVARKLVSSGARVRKDKQGITPIDRAWDEGNLAILNYLLYNASGEDIRMEYGWNDLYLLVYAGGKEEIEKAFKEKNYDVNWRDKFNRIPLHVAAFEGKIEVVSILLEKSAQINAVDDRGWTPLHYAALTNNAEIADLLIKSGADINIKAKDGKTAIDLAREKEEKEVIKLLQEAERKNGAIKK